MLCSWNIHLYRLNHCEARGHGGRIPVTSPHSPSAGLGRSTSRRVRPIMMTTMAALFGTLPIALGYGEGGDARQPLGLAVVGGLVVSQFL
ncbi:MAG: efflux RND transporter permease subunit, partial [Bryobacteraceae bacterium]